MIIAITYFTLLYCVTFYILSSSYLYLAPVSIFDSIHILSNLDGFDPRSYSPMIVLYDNNILKVVRYFGVWKNGILQRMISYYDVIAASVQVRTLGSFVLHAKNTFVKNA